MANSAMAWADSEVLMSCSCELLDSEETSVGGGGGGSGGAGSKGRGMLLTEVSMGDTWLLLCWMLLLPPLHRGVISERGEVTGTFITLWKHKTHNVHTILRSISMHTDALSEHWYTYIIVADTCKWCNSSWMCQAMNRWMKGRWLCWKYNVFHNLQR